MNDTITRDTVTETITALTATLERARTRLATEERDYIAKRDRMVDVAHTKGTQNSIGEALDDLLEEFDLPRRGEIAWLRGVVQMSGPMRMPSEGYATLESGTYVFTTGSPFRVSWLSTFEYRGSTRGDETCVCDAAPRLIGAWARGYYGTGPSADLTFQIGSVNCGTPACPNRPENRSDCTYIDPSACATTPWHERPIYRAVPEGTPPTEED